MAKVIEALKGLNSYPIPLRTLVETAEKRGLNLDTETTAEILKGKAYNLAAADIFLWLSFAPDVSQGGQSYSFTDEQRTQLRNHAKALYKDFDDDSGRANKPIYGYKGYPVKPSSVAWGEPVPCQFKAKKFNQLGIIKGEHFTVASYEILIEEQPVPSEQLRLKDLSGKEIGTFSIIQAEPLEAVCEVRILV
mgnify:CR=1 FL=1